MRNLSMKKFGTPIGAAPGTATERAGFEIVGVPSSAIARHRLVASDADGARGRRARERGAHTLELYLRVSEACRSCGARRRRNPRAAFHSGVVVLRDRLAVLGRRRRGGLRDGRGRRGGHGRRRGGRGLGGRARRRLGRRLGGGLRGRLGGRPRSAPRWAPRSATSVGASVRGLGRDGLRGGHRLLGAAAWDPARARPRGRERRVDAHGEQDLLEGQAGHVPSEIGTASAAA